MNLRVWLILGFLMVWKTAVAQDANPNSPEYHAVHNAQSPYYRGPQPGAQQPQRLPPQPTGYWEKTWGAIAPSPVGGVLGTAVGASSKEEAERVALADCKAKGGGACEVQIAYHNQCGVMTIGNERLFTASAGTVEEAKEYGLELCQAKDTNCRVYYSACTEPIFHRF